MLKIISLELLMLFVLFLTSCDQLEAEPTASADLIQPGDQIGGMVITAIDEWQFGNEFQNYCDESTNEGDPDTDIMKCAAYPGDQVQVNCLGGIADSPEELDESWSKTTWKMTIDDQVIDLPAFGTMGFYYGEINKQIRSWAVLIDGIVPGTHTIVCELVDEEGQKGVQLTFTVPDHGPVYPPLPAEGIAGQHPYRSEKAQLNLLLYFPSEYGKDPQKKWPLILFLHGGSEKGSDLERVKSESLPDILEDRKDLPFIVVSPQLSGKSGEKYWPQEAPMSALFTLLEEIRSTYSVDEDRIYFTGLSDGGAGVWEIGLSHPDYFSALVPVSGYYGYPFEVPDNICDLKEKPIWAFHGAEDGVIPLDAQQNLVEALESCGGYIQFTVYPGRGHDIGNLPYSNPELYEWLLSQKLE